jgi:hypothetical protein
MEGLHSQCGAVFTTLNESTYRWVVDANELTAEPGYDMEKHGDPFHPTV